MLNILAPTNNPKEVKLLIESGARELYCGVLSDEWHKSYTNIGSINRREFKVSNLKTFDELRQTVKTAHSYNVPVFLTMNAFYSKDQFELVVRETQKAYECDIDAVIVADMNLLLKIREINPDIDLHVSSGATLFNSGAVKFYKHNKVKRVILPRHLTLNEIKEMSKINGIEKEVFIMNTKCMNIDGFCTFQHGLNEIKNKKIGNIMKKMHFDNLLSNLMTSSPNISNYIIGKGLLGSTSACCLEYDVELGENSTKSHVINPLEIKENIKHNIGPRQLLNHCGACELYDFNNMNIDSIKIVGRQNPTKKKIKDIIMLKKSIDLIETCNSKDNFRQICKKNYNNVYSYSCKDMCYY